MSDSRTQIVDQLLTPKEVIGMLHISQATFYRILEGGLLPFYKVGRSLRIDHNDLMAYLSRVRVESGTE